LLDANPFFNNLAGVPRPAFRRNEFGSTVGGPIREDKTFFFADHQGIRLAQPLTITETIPTLAQQKMLQTGDFSGLGTAIYYPTVTTAAGGTAVRQAFAGNVIRLRDWIRRR